MEGLKGRKLQSLATQAKMGEQLAEKNTAVQGAFNLIEDDNIEVNTETHFSKDDIILENDEKKQGIQIQLSFSSKKWYRK